MCIYFAAMTPRLLLRLSTGLLTLFLIGHSLGSMAGTSRGAAEDAVVSAMQGYTFDIMGVTRTHWDFYQGLNHYLTAALIVFLLLLLITTRLADRSPHEARPLIWVLAAGQALFAVLSWVFFFPAPAVMTTLAAVFLGWAASRQG
jgi:hypothetical protein